MMTRNGGGGGLSKTSIALTLALVIVIALTSELRLIRDYLNKKQRLEIDVQSASFQHESKGQREDELTTAETMMDNATTDAWTIPLEDYDDNNAATNSSSLHAPAPQANNTPKFPSKINLNARTIRFLHPGKAGGGTIAVRLRKVWRLFIKQCHPYPCIEKKWQRANFTGQHPYMLISLRDPADRFVSAFYWRILKICHPEKEKRIERPKQMGKPCLYDLGKHDPNETEVLFYRYDRNASLLAQDLCSPNATRARIAEESLSTILHAHRSISDWLDFNWNGTLIFPLVVEPGASVQLEQQLDDAMYWLHNVVPYQKPEGFQRRATFADSRRQPDKNEHSSSKAKKSLTAAAEQCLEQYYRKDYHILKQLLDSACKTEGCRQAIQSIVDRRKRAFEDTSLPPINTTNS